MFLLFILVLLYIILKFRIQVFKFGLKGIVRLFIGLAILYFVVYIVTDIYSMIWFWFIM